MHDAPTHPFFQKLSKESKKPGMIYNIKNNYYKFIGAQRRGVSIVSFLCISIMIIFQTMF